MRIKEISVSGFKRFTDLTVSGLPETARLVVLVGPNGCGKSSLFDAMNFSARRHFVGVGAGELEYYHKGYHKGYAPDSSFDVRSPKNVVVRFHGPEGPSDWRRVFHIRSAYRHVPDLGAVKDPLNNEDQHAAQRLPRLNSHDSEIGVNFYRLHARAVDGLFEGGDRPARDIVEEITAPIRDVLSHVMPDLELSSLENPRKNVRTFYFAKGEVKRYAYVNLSGGERAAFDLLLDMVTQQGLSPDRVFCIDEPESHIGIGVQGKLLEVMYDFISDQSQLWIATHSIGMLRKASEIAANHPGEVVFLDFSGHNFDWPVVIEPAEPNRAFWRKMHDVALEDMSALVAPDTIVICESEKGFDAKCYNRIFSVTHPKVQFVSVGGKGILKAVRAALMRTEIGTNIVTLRDKDKMSPEAVKEYQTDGGRVLSRVCIEEYLSDDEVLEALCQKFECPQSVSILKEIRNKASHLKAPFEDIRKKMLVLSNDAQIGGDREDFMVNTLAPLITPETKVYRQLKEDIFGAE